MPNNVETAAERWKQHNRISILAESHYDRSSLLPHFYKLAQATVTGKLFVF